MGFMRQTSILTKKDLLRVAVRSWLTTLLRAIVLPIAYMFFIAYVRNFFLPPSDYGIGTPRPIRNLTTEVFGVSSSIRGRDRVVFVNNGFIGGQIEEVINYLATPLSEAGADVRILSAEEDLYQACQSSLRGISRCYASAEFHSSPTEGNGGVWNYTARADFGLGLQVFVNEPDNDAQLFVLPFIQAIDAAIAAQRGVAFPETILEYPFTYQTIQDREDEIQNFFMRALANYLAVTLFIGICGCTYHLPGYLATEREIGMSQLLDAMLPSVHRWQTTIARLFSAYVSFSSIYIAGWVAMGVIVAELIFYTTAASIVVLFHMLTGFSLVAWSLFGGTLFRRAQLSGITILILSLVLAVLAQFVPRSTATLTSLSVVFPPVTYTTFMIQLANWERQSQPANLNRYPPFTDVHTPGYLFFVFTAMQIILYLTAAVIMQQILYGKSFTSRRHVSSSTGVHAFRLIDVSKYFRPSWMVQLFSSSEHVVAVSKLSLEARQGEVLVLLGANGSGKSTTLGVIAGTIPISDGFIELTESSKSGLGFCPQKNVLWDELTVKEHIDIFHGLKAQDPTTTEVKVQHLIDACDLGRSAKSKAKILSGGQKRKLQLALAFAGDSRLCCIDEVSSGLDPLSRKIIWKILLAERGRRTLLLTTHALDEADALADEIVIMSKGALVAKGSAVELKHMHGGGYTITSSQQSYQGASPELQPVVKGSKMIFRASGSAAACETVTKLQKEGLEELQVEGPSIEDVFLKLASDYEQGLADFRNTKMTSSVLPKNAIGNDIISLTDLEEENLAQLQKGNRTNFASEVWILLRKRLLILSRNYLPYVCALVVPIVTAGLTTMFLGGFDRLMCSPGTLANNPQRMTLPALEYYWGLLVPVGPSDRFSAAEIPPTYAPYIRYLRPQDDFNSFQQYVADNFRRVVPGGFYIGDNITASPIMTYRINGNLGYSALAKNILDSYLLNTTIIADFTTFALPFTGGTGDSLQLILYFGFAMCAYPAFFALYPAFERLGNIRALHYSNGIRPAPLWLSYLAFDSIFIVIVSIITVVLFVTLSSVWFAPGYLFLVFLLYGIASTLFSYIVSLFTKTQLAAFAFIAGSQAILLLIYFIMYMVLITFTQQDQLFDNLNTVQFTYGLITPSGNLLRALLLALNQSQLLCRGQSLVSYPGDIAVYGGPILLLTLQSVFFYAFLVMYDSGWRPRWAFLSRLRLSPIDPEKNASSLFQPSDVRDEAHSAANSKAELKVLHLFKHFGRATAVDDLTFAVQHSEVFALLGPNGAGKSTTISLIRGDIKPSNPSSDILLEQHSVRAERLMTRSLLGVCPQFDTMDRLTVTEHLSFYARVRGVQYVRHNVETVMRAVGLFPYRKRMTAQLSGGNQRKLSLGTAMIGNPSVLLLDEPSSGMDAVAKRIMWKAIEGIKTGRSVVITTHSMEEATALADRAGIMAKKMLAVGQIEQLIQQNGKGRYHVHLALKEDANAEKTSQWILSNVKGAEIDGQVMNRQLRFIVSRVKALEAPSSRSDTGQDGHDTILQVQEPRVMQHSTDVTDLVDLLRLLEERKGELGIEYFSVSPTTLEDVFLGITTRARLADDESS